MKLMILPRRRAPSSYTYTYNSKSKMTRATTWYDSRTFFHLFSQCLPDVGDHFKTWDNVLLPDV